MEGSASMKEPADHKAGTIPLVRAALGLRAHSGWAVLVVVAGEPQSPTVIERQRVELADPRIPGSKQPYHAAEGLELEEAEQIVTRSAVDAQRLALKSLSAAIDHVTRRGHTIVACGLLLGSPRPTTSLAATLSSHPRIHAAEGELFRGALLHAGEELRLPITGVPERDVYACAADKLSLPEGELRRRLAGLGRAIGPPWREDEKYATLIGWLALAAALQR
jgi:hypothetical protein